MPRCAAERPRQMFPPPITTATCTPRSRTSLMRSAISRTTAGEILSRPPRSCTASPLSLSTIRLYAGFSMARRRHQTEHGSVWKAKCGALTRSAQCAAVPAQELCRAHAPFTFQLHFPKAKRPFAGRYDELSVAPQNFPGPAAAIDHPGGKDLQRATIELHECARPRIERADFPFDHRSRLGPIDSPIFARQFRGQGGEVVILRHARRVAAFEHLQRFEQRCGGSVREAFLQ